MDIKNYLNESELLHNGTCGFYSLTRGGNFHYHRQIEVVYVEKGTLTVSTAAKSLQLHANQFALIKSYELHTFFSKTRNKCICPILSDYYSNKLSQSNFESCVLDDTNGEVLGVFKLYHAFNKLSTENRLLYFNLIYKIIVSKLPKTDNQDKIQIDMIFKFIHENFDKPITIEQIANACNTNTNYVSTRINKHANVNFNSYVNRLRLAKFIDSFEPSKDKVTDCATLAGFESPRTFYRAFKQEYNMTPKEYFALMERDKEE